MPDTMTPPAAETTPRPKRGRPRVTPPHMDEMMAEAMPGRSRRTHIKHYKVLRALTVLEAAPEQDISYLIGEAHCRQDIMAELGRIEDDDRLREAAAFICEHRMKTKDALVAIRRFRLGGSAPGSTWALVEEITRTIQDYRNRHPDMTDARVRMALELAAAAEEQAETDVAV